MPELYLPQFSLKQPPRNQKTVEKCQQCGTDFSLTKREHLCKRCYKFVCDACSPHKEKVYKANMHHRFHRLCNSCYTQSQILGKYVQVNKIVWGQDSDLGRLWVKQAGYHRQEGKRKTDGRRKRVEYTASPEVFWNSFNFSFRELIGRAIDESKRIHQQAEQHSKKQKQKLQFIHNKVTQQILQIFSLLMSQLNNTSSIEHQHIIIILVFFLIHCSSDNAISLTKSALQFLTSNQLSVENVCFYLRKLEFTQNQCYKVENYLESHLEKIARGLTINYFSTEISIEIISALFAKKNYGEIQRAIAYVLSKRKEFILINSNKAESIEIDLLRNHQGLGDGYKKFVKLLGTDDSSPPTRRNPQQNTNNAKNQKEQENPKIKQKQYTYDELKQQNQQLKIKNKNQQDQINSLKQQNKKLTDRQKLMQEEFRRKTTNDKREKENQSQQFQFSNNKDDLNSDRSDESYWEEVVEQHQDEIKMHIEETDQHHRTQSKQKLSEKIKKVAKNSQHPQFTEFDKFNQVVNEMNGTKQKHQQSRKKLVKKHRKKQNHTRLNRLSTRSEQLVKQIQQLHKTNQSSSNNQLKLKYQQIVYNKNQEILMLNKQLDIIKFSSKLREEQDKAKVKPESLSTKPAENSIKLSTGEQNKRLASQLANMQDMNKKLLLKIKQLTNLLMDKQEEQVKQSEQTLQQLVQVYEEQNKDPNQQCQIF